MYGSDDINNLKESFTIMKAITIRTTTLKMTILLYVTVYVCKVYCLKKPYNKPLINLDRLVIAGKYQTSVFYVRTSPCGLEVRAVKTSVFYVRTSPCGLAVCTVKTSVFYVRTSPCGLEVRAVKTSVFYVGPRPVDSRSVLSRPRSFM